MSNEKPKVFDIMDYGPKIDECGHIDITEALQRAYNAASNGGTIYFPAGEYHQDPIGPRPESPLRLPGEP